MLLRAVFSGRALFRKCCDRIAPPEFANYLMQEFVALVGIRHRFGAPWRPVEQGGVERVHQEMQKILGILILDVVRTARS